MRSPTTTWYEILEVSSDANHEEIHQAFLRAKQTYSPESPALYSVFSREEAEELMRLIEEAYSILGNPIKRKAYDDMMREQQKIKDSSHLKLISSESTDHKPTEKDAEVDAWTEARLRPPASRSWGEADKGGGRTPFSHYKIDETFESEIAAQEVFDGSFIQKIRQYKNVNLDQVVKATRIGRHYLVAIEANDFHSLPAPVFVRGYVLQVAKILGLPETKVADSFMKLFKVSREK